MNIHLVNLLGFQRSSTTVHGLTICVSFMSFINNCWYASFKLIWFSDLVPKHNLTGITTLSSVLYSDALKSVFYKKNAIYLKCWKQVKMVLPLNRTILLQIVLTKYSFWFSYHYMAANSIDKAVYDLIKSGTIQCLCFVPK